MDPFRQFAETHRLPHPDSKPDPSGAALLAAGVEAALTLDKGNASAQMAKVIGRAIVEDSQSAKPSCSAAEKMAKASQDWQAARQDYTNAVAGLVVVKAYGWAMRRQAEGPEGC